MAESFLKAALQEDMKTAMRAKDSKRLSVIRFLLAAIKQKEIDEQITLDDTQTLAVIEKSIKQRRDSIEQFKKANRDDLVEKETYELTVLQTYMPEALSEEELDTIIQDALAQTGAETMRDMGKVMGIIKPKIQGRADMGQVSAKIKSELSS